MNYCTDGKFDEHFYRAITSSTINEYMSSIRYKTGANGEAIKIGNEIRATRWSALNTFFTYLKSNNLIDNNPMEQTFRPSCKKDKTVTYLTEEEICNVLKNLKGKKTIIVIAHRLSTIKFADKIAFMENEKIKAKKNFF